MAPPESYKKADSGVEPDYAALQAAASPSRPSARDSMMPRPTPELQREYQRVWIAGRRASWLADKACVRCGSADELCIHHRDPAEKVAHAIWSWSADRRLAELAKCDVLCRSCHEEHHAAKLRRHGSRNRYRSGCRCDPCRAAKARENAKYLAGRALRERSQS